MGLKWLQWGGIRNVYQALTSVRRVRIPLGPAKKLMVSGRNGQDENGGRDAPGNEGLKAESEKIFTIRNETHEKLDFTIFS
jgi:hypothetical protein